MVPWAEKEASIRALEHNGHVDPDDLIEAARSPEHPCHNDFTWDVEQAAREHWRGQATGLIRRVHFEVKTEEVTEPVVMYVARRDGDRRFRSLPKVHSKVQAGSILAAEVAMLHGLAARVYGIAASKQGLVGADKVAKLRRIRDTLGEMKAEFEG